MPGKKKVVIDSSSFILLCKIKMICNLVSAYQLMFSETVVQEITRTAKQPGAVEIKQLIKNNDIIVKQNNTNTTNLNYGNLHPGEKTSIQLYVDNPCDFIIIDDKNGVQFCRKNNIPFINALLSIKILWLCKCISYYEYLEKSEQLLKIARYSSFVIAYADNMSEEQLQYFFCR